MEPLSVREYRNNLASAFDRADQGEQVLIRRKNSIYILTSAGKEDITLSPQKQREVDAMAASIKRSWAQVRQMEDGLIPAQSAIDFLNEL